MAVLAIVLLVNILVHDHPGYCRIVGQAKMAGCHDCSLLDCIVEQLVVRRQAFFMKSLCPTVKPDLILFSRPGLWRPKTVADCYICRIRI